jgi:hypothetical protein
VTDVFFSYRAEYSNRSSNAWPLRHVGEAERLSNLPVFAARHRWRSGSRMPSTNLEMIAVSVTRPTNTTIDRLALYPLD